MIHDVLLALVPNDPASVARIVACCASGSVAYAAATHRARRSPKVSETPEPTLAGRIRARMNEQPEIVVMSDQLVERIAGILAPVPPAADTVPLKLPHHAT